MKKNIIQLSDHFTTPKLLRFAFPSILMMVFTSIYGIVDGFFVSNFAGKTSFAAVNFAMPALLILGSIGFMLGTGGCALIGKTLGEGDRKKANELFSMLVYIAIGAGLVLAIAGMFLLGPVLRMMGADDAMLVVCLRYGRIVLLGLPALLLQYEFQSFFVVAEKPEIGLYSTVAAGLMNIVMDALLVGWLRLDVEGAAAATALSQLTSAVIPMIYFSGDNTSLLRLGRTSFDRRALAKSLMNGTSEFVSSISMSVVSMLYEVQLLKYAGENGVAAYGVLMYVSMIFLAIFIGYAVGTAPIFSFNFGAQNRAELHSLLKRSLIVNAVFAVLMLAAGEFLCRPFSALYVGYDAELMSMTVQAFVIFSFSFPCASLPIFGSSFFTALNDGVTSALISFLRTVVFEMGAVLLLPLIFGVKGIWYSLVVADLTAAVVTVFFLVTKQKKFGY